VFVGAVIAGLLAAAAPARASGLRLADGLRLQDLWSSAWSWMAELWPAGDGAEGAAVPRAYSKDNPGPPPGPPKPKPPAQTNGGGHGGDNGGGSDPDG